MSTTVTSSKPKRVHTKKSTTVAGLDLKTASVQDVFDFVVFKLIQQGKAAIAAGGSCRYLTADGCKCGIGQIIPDGLYLEALEGNIVKDLLGGPNFLKEKGLLSPTSFAHQLRGWVGGDADRAEFLTALQTAHDTAGSNFLEVFRYSARQLAARHGLDSSIVGYREPVRATPLDVVAL